MRCSRRRDVTFLLTAASQPTPHHRLRRSLSSRRSLLVSASANYRHPPCLIIKPPWQRTAQLDAGRAQHDRRGNIQGNGWRLRRSGHAEFSLPRGAAVPPSSFINLTFTSQRSLLWYFLGLQESTVLPSSRPSVVPSFLPLPNWRCFRY